jgi:hypothetical protein
MKITTAIAEHLRFLEQNGRLTPSRVVEDAKRPESPLHKLFDWDVQKAAEQFWLDRARDVIRAVKVVITTDTITVRSPYYVPDPSKNGKEQGYTNLDALREDPSFARQALMAECERASGVMRRARVIALALGMTDKVDAIMMHLAGLRSTVASEEGVTPPS